MNWLYRIFLIFLLCAGSVHVYAQNTSAQESRKRQCAGRIDPDKKTTVQQAGTHFRE